MMNISVARSWAWRHCHALTLKSRRRICKVYGALNYNWRKSCNIGTSILFVKMRPFRPNWGIRSLPLVSQHASRYGAALVHGTPGRSSVAALSCNLVSEGIVHRMKGSLHWKAKRTFSLQHGSAPHRNQVFVEHGIAPARSVKHFCSQCAFIYCGPSHCCDSASTTGRGTCTSLTLTFLRIAGKWRRRRLPIEHHVLTADPWIASTDTSSNEIVHQLHPHVHYLN